MIYWLKPSMMFVRWHLIRIENQPISCKVKSTSFFLISLSYLLGFLWSELFGTFDA